MEFKLEDIVDKFKGEAAVIAAHGGSLNKVKEKIDELHQEGKIKRFSMNNCFNFFITSPDVWVLASSVDTVKAYKNVMNSYNAKVFFSDTADPTATAENIAALTCDFCNYDQRHFAHQNCKQIYDSFLEHYNEHADCDFFDYGNNAVMWQDPRFRDGAGFDKDQKGFCCSRIQQSRKTIQEVLQDVSGYSQHYSTGDSVAIHAIALAILYGCNPIYIAGMDLDYGKGYANSTSAPSDPWVALEKNMLSDLNILNESAKARGISIVNTTHDTWYGIFKEGEIE